MRFKPSLLSTIVLFSLAALFISLGQWQSARADAKARSIAAFERASRAGSLPESPDPTAFTRVALNGRFDARHQWLVDNQIHESRPGWHVLTPFTLDGEGTTVLVNRGWLAQSRDRSQVPEIPEMTSDGTITGFLAPLRTPGIRLGDTPPVTESDWPRRVVWPDIDRMARELGQPLYPLALYLDADNPAGLDGRDWQPVSMGPDRHRGYALQWYALAATAIAGWAILATRRRQR